MLVVIAIIALMASLLTPAIGKARESAQRVACSSNMRQIALGIRMYLDDNDGKFPGPMYHGQGPKYRIPRSGSAPTLAYAIHQYVGAPEATNQYQHLTVMNCPGYNAQINLPFDQRLPYQKEYALFGYPPAGREVRSLFEVTSPSQVYLIRDRFNYEGGNDPRVPNEPVHGKFTNYAFVDGSVRAIPFEESLLGPYEFQDQN